MKDPEVLSKKIFDKINNTYDVNFNYYCVSKKQDKNNLKYVNKFFIFLNSGDVKKITKKVKIK